MWRGVAAGRRRGVRITPLIALLIAVLAVSVAATTSSSMEEWGVMRVGATAVLYQPGDSALARRVLLRAERTPPFPGLPRGLGEEEVRIVLAPSPAEFVRHTGGRVPDWTAGVAIPAQGRIILPGYGPGIARGRELERTLRHELAHIAIHRNLPSPVPRWFDEGYATWVAGGLDGQAVAWELRLAFLLGRIPPLDSLHFAWPVHAGEARFAYILSATAVRHLATRRGPQAFEAFMEGWRRTGSANGASLAAFGVPLHAVEDEWRRTVRRRYGWAFAFGQLTLFWAVVGALLVFAYLERRRRMRRRIRSMDRDDHARAAEGSAGVDDPWEQE